MRRNSSDLRYLGYGFGVLSLFAYEIATSIYLFLPPLIGLFFTYMIIEYAKKQQKSYMEFGFGWHLSIAFLLFAEQIHGFYMFSSLIAFIIFFYFMVDWLFSTMKYRNFLLIIFVFSGYLGVYLVSNAINYLQNKPFLYIDAWYGFYIFIESVFAIVLFKEKVV
ncbi:hypothetical protein [Campylobacter gastrosuis]|uniref:Integral membrane protein n=1 Tax=Campylobacter gastrosuis TaxID=2974576 RepID=A0ABT7HS22_9BACT|nr:hypothetical protein [Campylobacter gastrosuis]MDL0089213.1 hypothetical protein [Campylobacter gastrosuis]